MLGLRNGQAFNVIVKGHAPIKSSGPRYCSFLEHVGRSVFARVCLTLHPDLQIQQQYKSQHT